MQEGWKHREYYRQFKEAVKNEGGASTLMTKNDKKAGIQSGIKYTLPFAALLTLPTGQAGSPEEI